VDVPQCSLTYGVSPCQASLVNSPPTGTIKCFNSLGTCQDRANFTDVPITLTFGEDVRFDHDDYLNAPPIDSYPLIKEINFQPAIVSLGNDLGQRASLTVTFRDAKHSDPGTKWDKYASERTYTDPYNRGTFWGKFRARNPFLRGRSIRLYRGELGQSLAAMEIHHFIVDSIDGPNVNGDFKIVAKDVLKLTDGDRAQAPFLSEGFLASDITNSATTATLSPSSIGNDYPEYGYASIGGNEAVSYVHSGGTATDDGFTKLLLHFNNLTDAGTAFVDSSPSAKVIPGGGVGGNAQTDTAQFKFGVSSGLFDGSGDYILFNDSNDWDFGTGNFTIDFWVRFNSISGEQVFVEQFIDGSNAWIFEFNNTGTGTLRFLNLVSGVTLVDFSSAGSQFVTNTWYHVAMVRNGTDWRIYKNGTSVASQTVSATMPNFASQLLIATHAGPAFGINGWLDEFRISKGVARWTTAFTPPTAAYTSFNSGAAADTLTIARGKLNTTAVSHSAQDRVQTILIYDSQDPANVIYDLMVTYADVDPNWITLSDWQTETASQLSVLCTFYIGEPTGVKDLINEIIEQFGIAIWWDDINEEIRLQVLRAVATTADRYNEDNVLENTLQVREQPEKRISRVNVYFSQINPLLKKDELTNYRSTAQVIDDQSEADEGSAAIKTIYARSIPLGGRSIAERIAQKYLSRYVRPPRRFNFEVMKFAELAPAIGLGARLGGGTPQVESWPFQDETGARVDAPIQITRLNPLEDKFVIEAEEMLFTAYGVDIDPTAHNVIFDVSTLDVNLRDVHDDLFGTPTSGDTVSAYVNSGVIIGSSSSSTPAFTVGTFPAGVTVNVFVIGRIEGKGGSGGNSHLGFSENGEGGGTALYTRQNITLNLSTGAAQIWGGGGGGGSASESTSNLSASGGGGAGSTPGAAGNPNPASWAVSGASGSTEAGGAGSSFVLGNDAVASGAGGGPGLAGGSSTFVQNGVGPLPAQSGGAAGTGIDGVSQCTKVGTGDIRGSQVN